MSNLNPDEVCVIPLGGSEQFGVNLNIYSYKDSLLAVDCGVGFADERFPGIDLLLPDPKFLEENSENLKGLVITHAHEDHVGAVAYLWPKLRCPVYCSPFTAAVLRHKLTEAGLVRDVNVQIIRPGNKAFKEIGPFRVGVVHVSHSIPDTRSLIIETDLGRIVHSGDWNLDPAPVLGEPTNEEKFKDAGEEGVLAYIGDSTNSMVPGRTGTESDVEKGLEKVFAECKGRIAVTMFASNVGRLRSVALAAKATGRSVALVGRSLHTMTGCAQSCGYLDGIQKFLDMEDIDRIPADKIVIAVTGSQGEARAALARIAKGEFREFSLGRGDTVIFSARPIPGNEKDINQVKNNLASSGVRIVTPDDTEHKIHISGHPCREEILDMYRWLKPQIVVPVHGEKIQLEAQAELARSHGIEKVIVPNNGSVIRLAPGEPDIVDHIETGIIAVDQNRLLPSDHPSINSRRKLQYTGAAHVTLVLDGRGQLARDPQVSTEGLCDPDIDDLEIDLVDEIVDILEDMTWEDLEDEHLVSEEIRIGVRRYCNQRLGMKPKTTVHLVRI
jgi:ribonuclease J